jgi:surface antigen
MALGAGRNPMRISSRRTRSLCAGLCSLALALGCASYGPPSAPNKTTIGGLGGAAAGGLTAAALDANAEGIIAGVIAGGLLGALGGNLLDQRDRELAARTAQLTLETSPTGHSLPWQNPDTGNNGAFTPTRTYWDPAGQYCREYTQEIWVGGERQLSYGRACRQPDGSWKLTG